MKNNNSNAAKSSLPSEPSERSSHSAGATTEAENTSVFYLEGILDTPLFKTINQINMVSMASHPLMQTLATVNNSPAVKAMEAFRNELVTTYTTPVMSAQANSTVSGIMHQISDSVHYYDSIMKSLSRQAMPALSALNKIASDYQIIPRISNFLETWSSCPAGQIVIKSAGKMQEIRETSWLASRHSLPLEKIFRTIVEQGYLNLAQSELAIQCWEDALTGLTQPSEGSGGLYSAAEHVSEGYVLYEPEGQGSPPSSQEGASDEFLALLSNNLLADGFKKLPLSVQMFISWFFVHILVSMFEDSVKAAMLDGINAVKTEFTSQPQPQSGALRKSSIVTAYPNINWKQLDQFRLIAGANVRLRSSPSMNSETIEMLNKGTVVAIMETQGRQWLYVQVDCAGEKVYGWINRSYTSRLRN